MDKKEVKIGNGKGQRDASSCTMIFINVLKETWKRLDWEGKDIIIDKKLFNISTFMDIIFISKQFKSSRRNFQKGRAGSK